MTMIKLELLINSDEVDEVKKVLREIGIKKISLSEIKEYGQEYTHEEGYRGTKYIVDFVKKVNISILLNSTERIERTLHMLTVANKSIKQAPITLSYYKLEDILGLDAGSAVWADVQIDAGIPVKFGLQGGSVMPENDKDDTTAFGLKVSGKAGPVALNLAYTSVDDGSLPIDNQGTGVKTPLYTQMILNQKAIKLDADTVMLKAVTPVGPGKVIAQYAMTTANDKNLNGDGNDYNELDVIYKFKALGTTMLAAYVMQDLDSKDDPNNIIRFWTRYNF